MLSYVEFKQILYNKKQYVSATSGFGKLRGRIKINTNGNCYYSFEGIPYVQAPVEHLRFKSPLPLIDNLQHKDYFDATTKQNVSPQNVSIESSQQISEDCLYLNVYVPQNDNYPLPVMVYIHEGNFQKGYYEKNFEKEFDLLMSKDIILVTFNYRLGVLGFLRLNAYLLDINGNGGLKDIVLLLKWIQNNICYFNGDPNNVTIIGNEAGGAAAHLMMFSSMAKGLFHKVIIQNGCALSPWVFVPHKDLKLADICNYEGFINTMDIYDYLKNRSTKILLNAEEKLISSIDICVGENKIFGPVIEMETASSFITKHPKQILKSDDYYKVPMMIGFTSDIGLNLRQSSQFIFSQKDNNMYDKYYVPRHIQRKLLNPIKIQKLGNRIKNFYLDITKKHFYFIKEILTDFGYLKSIRKCIKAHVKNGDSIYYYTLNRNSRQSRFDLVFDDIKTLDILTSMWVNFAYTGNPNPIPNYEDILTWNSIESTNAMNCLCIGSELSIEMDPFGTRISKVNKMIYDELIYRDERTCKCCKSKL